LRSGAAASLDRLTDREHQILGLMAEAGSNAGIAGRLQVSKRTVEAAGAEVFRKLDVELDHDSNRPRCPRLTP
jgi:DNA-binding NarL/FixJ family response regulator